MDPLNQVPPIRPVIPPLTRGERVPRVERDEKRQPARDEQHPPGQDPNQYDDSYDAEWEDWRETAAPTSGEIAATEDPKGPEKDSVHGPPNVDRRLSYDPAGGLDDERPGPHIDITA